MKINRSNLQPRQTSTHAAESARRKGKFILKLFVAVATVALVACQTNAVITPGDVRPVKGLYDETATNGLDIATLTQRADAGDPHAQNDLGVRYGTGKGIPKDSSLSFRYYEQAAKQGLATAQCNLAYMYQSGEGIARDKSKEIEWYSACARQGHFQGQYALGRMHALGEGLRKDGLLAEKWFLLSANQGFLPAQQALLHMYEHGEGVPRNPSKAVTWLHRVRDAKLWGKVWKEED